MNTPENLTLGNTLISVNTASRQEVVQETQCDTSESNTEEFVDVSVDLIQRIYAGLYLINQTIEQSPVGPEERSSMMAMLISNTLVTPLTEAYSVMTNFDYSVSCNENGATITGNNNFTNTILSAIQQSQNSPISEIDNDDDHSELAAKILADIRARSEK